MVAVVVESFARPKDVADGQVAATAWLGATVLVTVGALVGAAMLAPQGSATPMRGFALLLFLGSSVHVASTGWLYTLPDVRAYAVRRQVRYIWAPIALIVVAGYFLMNALRDEGKREDCLMSGRSNCVPLDIPTHK